MGRSFINRGWILSVTGCNDKEPSEKKITKLYIKAWNKPFKIYKFYR